MPAAWPAIPYDEWSATCETLHGHTQVLGKLAVALAPPEPHAHEAVVEHSEGRVRRVPLTPHRTVGEVTRDVLTAVGELVGAVEIDLKPQEVDWALPLDEDT